MMRDSSIFIMNLEDQKGVMELDGRSILRKILTISETMACLIPLIIGS